MTNRVKTYDEITILIDLCRKGRLFEVQDWIARGNSVNPPAAKSGKGRRQNPLEIAIERGFHSLVQVLVESGASMEEPRYSALLHALAKKRLDIVQLLVKNGAKIDSVDMTTVFETWDKEIIRFFIEKGVDCQAGHPLAFALSNRIRPALAIYKEYKDRFPHFNEQINMALRYHCKEGNLKWVSLLLWAGADPYTKGPHSPNDEPEDHVSALELAALYGHIDVFKLKGIHLDPSMPGSLDLLTNSCFGDKADLLRKLLEKGFSPKDIPDKGTSIIESILYLMTIERHTSFLSSKTETNLDTFYAKEKMKMLHLLVRHGARWEPTEKYSYTKVRSALRTMSPDYTMEFIWIMTEYQACTVEILEILTRPPSMRSLIKNHLSRYNEIMHYYTTSVP